MNASKGGFDYGALGRNTGEVLGVFGEVVIEPRSAGRGGYVSSADVENLNRLELLLKKLAPPVWPVSLFGEPGDSVARSDGESLFKRNCANCHTPRGKQYERMVTFGEMGEENRTDEWMACNTWDNTGSSGVLTGTRSDYLVGEPLDSVERVTKLLSTSIKGALVDQGYGVAFTAIQTVLGITPLPGVIKYNPQVFVPGGKRLSQAKHEQLQRCLAVQDSALMAYKARPLEGIWATAPFLHNGSVPTLAELLLPAASRQPAFSVGTRIYDPVNGGYSTDPHAPGNTFIFDTSLPGNSNKGHNYGVGALTPTQRQHLLAYLKTL